MEIADGHSIDVSLYGHYGGTDDIGHQGHAKTYSLDALYKWKPAKEGEWNSFLVGAQVIKTDRTFTNAVDTDADGIPDTFNGGESQAMGYLLWAQYQLDRRWYVGVRYDHSEFLNDDSLEHSRVTPYVSCYLSEFLRIRASVERTTSDLASEDGLTTFMFELNVILGAHPPHPFWVNR